MATTLSRVAAIRPCISAGSLPDTQFTSYPYPSSRAVSSESPILASTVGLAILYPFKCSTGSTAPSETGFRNLLPCQPVASGPVSASPSPTMQQTNRPGLSKAAPKACDSA